MGGLAPESYESAGKNRSRRTTRGNKYIKSILVMAGGLAGRSKYPVFCLFTIEYPIKDSR
ncbi:hypothetical protein CL176_06175 [Suicoccus acidiformans]|uniref:Transposase IS116/IS110/IS902 C-terminal domain-containing protein n=1 Tax=Suicoccus acidiformans TaxID=2036206 RepID=A0A347WKK8_9LACT|nr:hypothetical protein CL176_06175 [Suicoccus acidiformans]